MQSRSKNCLHRIAISLFFTILLTPVFSQTIRGKIRDSNTGEPMTGATVMLDHTQYITTVQLDGSFTFRHIPAGKYKLVASTIGYLLPFMVSGSIIISVVLSLPTVGPLLLRSLLSQDMLLASTIILLLGLLTVIGTLISDLLLMWIDPRIRLGQLR